MNGKKNFAALFSLNRIQFYERIVRMGMHKCFKIFALGGNFGVFRHTVCKHRYHIIGGGIAVYGGTLTMNEGSSVKNNAVTNTNYSKVTSGTNRTGNSDSLGGGVAVYENGTFIMNGGEISQNVAAVSGGEGRAFGGGVGLMTRGANAQVSDTPDDYYIGFYMYGGTKYAYYRKGQLILSQTLGTVIANALMYMQIIMVVGQFPLPAVWPMLVLCVPEFLIIALINQMSDGIFRKMFPPKHLLLICDLEYKELLLRKISSRKDLYEVSRCVSASEPLSVLQKEVADCDAMMLYGIEEQKRNALNYRALYECSYHLSVSPFCEILNLTL